MARPPLATVEDLEVALGAPVPDEDQALYLLRRASAIVRAYAGRTWLDDDGELADVPDDIPDLVVGMVERATRNPDGLTQQSSGPFSRSWGADAAHRIYMTRDEKMVIKASVGALPLGTISTTRGRVEMPSAPWYRSMDAGML